MSAHAMEFLAAHADELRTRLFEHIELVALALVTAVAIGVPVAVAVRKNRPVAGAFLGLAGVVQTIPSLALLSIMLPLFGLGRNSAVAALFLYALLPVIRNTLVGLASVAPDVTEVARGLGMDRAQLFWNVELPLALPTIFAGLRIAAVINVGVATLGALVGAGGLGVFIFRGIANNQPAVVLLGAVPAALLALTIDGLLGLAERMIVRHPWRVAVAGTLLVAGCLVALWQPGPKATLLFGFPTGFVQRADGYDAWRQHYQLPPVRFQELDVNLLYDTLRRGETDVAFAGAIDGRIDAFGLRVLADDRNFFPPYDGALLARKKLFQRVPTLRPLLEKLNGALTTETIRQLDRRVAQDGLTSAAAAREFLRTWTKTAGIDWQEKRAAAKSVEIDSPDILIGAKTSAVQYLLGRILEQLIDGATGWNAQLKSSLGSTAICFESLRRGDIDLYPEYNGMLAVTIFDIGSDPAAMDRLRDGDQLNRWLAAELARRYDLEWMPPLGFSSNYVMLVRADDARFNGIKTMSELAERLRR